MHRIERGRSLSTAGFALAVTLMAACGGGSGSDDGGSWTFWRGPFQTGEAVASGLVSSWSPEGENLAWRVDFVGRSTPVVVGDRVCAIGRVGVKQTAHQEERVACFGIASGEALWDYSYPIYHTTVAFNRAGWASLAADAETGYVYAHGVAGQLHAFDENGEIVWRHFLPETVGRASGYGGRTQTPIVDGDLLVLSFVNGSWGDQAAPRHRTFAFDKRTGDIVWIATPGEFPKDMNTQGGPIVEEIAGRRMIVSGNADGWVYALDAHTGETVWKFQLSKRGINVHPVVSGDTVFISHSEENIDAPVMGRVVALDATGEGDVTATAERWRIDELQAGFPSPLLHDGKLYVVDNSANMYRVDAATGAVDWEYSIGTVGKGSPVWADGKIYVGEVNGRFHILSVTDEGASELDMDELEVESGRYAELYGSPAVARGMVFFTAESGLYALGSPEGSAPQVEAEPAGAVVARHLAPKEVLLEPGEPMQLRVVGLDAANRIVDGSDVEFELDGLQGEIDGLRFTPSAEVSHQAGAIRATFDGTTSEARVRVVPPMPWNEDFEDHEVGSTPATWIGAARKFFVAEHEGGKVIVQPPRERGLQRSFTFLGPPGWSDYTVQVDVKGTRTRRRMPDVGVMNAGYTLDMKGVAQELEIRSWAAELRMADQVPFEWDMDTWYTMKLRTEVSDGQATIRGKVWKRGEAEPDDWTIVVEDPYPVSSGGPGLIGYAPADVFYDNLRVTENP